MRKPHPPIVPGHDSSMLLATGGNGVKEITDMQLGHQLWLCGSEVPGKHLPPMARQVLLSEFYPKASRRRVLEN